MTTAMIIFIIAYMAVTVAYLFSETSGVFKRRAINKIFLASMFLVYAIVETVNHGDFSELPILFLVGIFFSWVGDVGLLWSFSKGGAAFAAGNVILFIYEIKYVTEHGFAFSEYWWFLIIFALLLGMFISLQQIGWLELGKMKAKFTVYICTVTLHGTLGIAGLILLHDVKSILLCAGLLLFMVSDYFITLHKFKYKESKAILRCNSFTYFTGLLLAVLSISF